MNYINTVELRGKIGSIKEFPINNDKIYNFSLCTLLTYSDGSSNVVNTTWHSIKVLSKNVTGELKIGKTAHVKGTLENVRYVDSEGLERVYTNINADKVEVE